MIWAARARLRAMRIMCLGFLAGVLFCQTGASLPSAATQLAAAAGAVVAFGLARAAGLWPGRTAHRALLALTLLGALLALGVFFAPWAATAALRIALE